MGVHARLRTSLGIGIVATAAALASAAPAAAGGIEIRQVDARAYPRIRVTVVAPTVSASAPTLAEDGAAAGDFSAENLAGQQSIALLVDRSQSMHGRTLAAAIDAARAFVAAKPAPDQISVVAFAAEATTLADFSNVDGRMKARSYGKAEDATASWPKLWLGGHSARQSLLAATESAGRFGGGEAGGGSMT